jgi:hypothetical protein
MSAQKFLTPIDMNNNEIQNVRIQQLASDPGSPVEGQIWENTTSHTFKVFLNGATVTLGASSGTVSTVSVVTANGFAGSVANNTSTPAITVSTSVTGITKGDGTALSAATAGTDYVVPSGNITGTAGNLSGTPTLPNGTAATTQTAGDSTTKLATTAFVAAATSALAQGFQIKPTATVVDTAAMPAGTYSNGTAGVGATFTVTATGTTTIDGHVLAAADLVLLTAQASAFQNGLYTVTTAGTTGVSTVLTRHVDMDSAAEFSGALIPVGSTGTAQGNSLWLANPSGTVTVGTTSIPLSELNKATDLAAGTGITITGNSVAVTGYSTLPHIFNSAAIGDGSATSLTVTHNLNNSFPLVQVYSAAAGGLVICGVVATSANVVTLSFTTAPASSDIHCVVVG